MSSTTGLRRPSAVLFDMDGTLVDTEPWWFAAERAYTLSYGAAWDESDAHEMVGAPLAKTTARLARVTGSGQTHAQIRSYLINFLLERFENTAFPWRPGMAELTARLHSHGVPMALVTSSHRPIAEAVTSRLPWGLFSAVISADDVERLKPHPEPYLKAMAELQAEPDLTIVIEDSASGLASAHASGARVVGIPCVTPIARAPERSRVKSGDDLTDQVLHRLISGEVIDLT